MLRKPPLAESGGFAFATLHEDHRAESKQGSAALLNHDANLSIDKLRLTVCMSRQPSLLQGLE
jgi:hypothetical protein